MHIRHERARGSINVPSLLGTNLSTALPSCQPNLPFHEAGSMLVCWKPRPIADPPTSNNVRSKGEEIYTISYRKTATFACRRESGVRWKKKKRQTWSKGKEGVASQVDASSRSLCDEKGSRVRRIRADSPGVDSNARYLEFGQATWASNSRVSIQHAMRQRDANDSQSSLQSSVCCS